MYFFIFIFIIILRGGGRCYRRAARIRDCGLHLFEFLGVADFLIMRTLKLLSFGPASLCWTAQVAPFYVASQQFCTSVCAAHEFISGVQLRERGGIRQKVRPRLAERSFSELLSTSYDGFGVPGGFMHCQRQLHSRVASKKGKKSEKDVLVEDREEEVEGEGETEKVEGKKKKKKKQQKSKDLSYNGVASEIDDGAVNAQNIIMEEVQDSELHAESKGKKKLKEKAITEGIENEQADSVLVQNGAFTAEIREPKLSSEGKEEKKLKNKIKHGEPGREKSNESNSSTEFHKKEKKDKKKLKDKGTVAKGAVSGVVVSESAEEHQALDGDDESSRVIEDDLAEELGEHLDDDDFWEDDFEPEAELNDGGDGGGIVLGDAPWAKAAHRLAEETVAQFDGLEIFAFKASKESGIIRVRVDKLSDKYGSPSMDEIQKFSSTYSKALDKAGEEKTVPDDLALEVSSPGAERVVRIPQDLERFKDLPMYVSYIETSSDSSSEEKDGILELESFDVESGSAKWKLANVRLNRDLAGKGRGMNRNQRDWRLDLSFENTRMVRLYIDM